MRLAAGLRPDPLGELERSPRPPSRNRGVLLLRGREEREVKEKEGEGKGTEEEKRLGKGGGCLLFIYVLATGLCSIKTNERTNLVFGMGTSFDQSYTVI